MVNPDRRQFLNQIGGITALALSPFRVLEVLAEEPSKNYKTSDFSDDSDEVTLARMIFGEARSCEDLERVAVGYTAVNRANDGKKWNGETVKEAVLKPWQYSCFNENDPNREKLMNPQMYDEKSFRECLDIARGVLSGERKDVSEGATHYFNPQYARPDWASKLEKIGKIEIGKTEDGRPVYSKHEFYREK